MNFAQLATHARGITFASQTVFKRPAGAFSRFLTRAGGCNLSQVVSNMIQREAARPIEVLLVEDNAGDIGLTKEAFKEGRVHLNLSVARDGVEAMAFLRKEGDFAGAARPDLVLLDLNLPKMDGRQVLREMKKDSALLSIPVVVLTTSASDEDILESYGLHANCYITKPVDMEQFFKVIKVFEEFWFVVAKIPSGNNR